MKKYTNYLIFLALNILIAVAIFGIYFMYQKIENALSSQERIKLEQEIQSEQIENLPELASRYQKIEANEQYFRLLYTEDKVVDIIKDIERLAKEQGVTLTITQKEVPIKKAVKKETTATDKEKEDEKKVEVPKELVDTLPFEKHIRLELKARGEYLSLRNFLHKIETSPYALDVLSIQGEVAPADEDTITQSRTQSSSPFLLAGPESDTKTSPAVLPTDIVFLIEVALYIQ